MVEKYWNDKNITDALDTMANGGLCLLKGDIGYGFFGTSEKALKKMYALKGRPYSNPCIVIGNLRVLRDIAEIPHPRIWDWIETTSAKTTMAVVLPERKNSRLLDKLPSWVYGQTVTRGTVAAFLNTGPYLEEVIDEAYERGILFVGTSANPSFTGNIFDFKDLPRSFVEGADFNLDHGKAKYANKERKATTILNFTNWTVKRRGVNWEWIEPEFFNLKRELQVESHA